MTRIAVMRIKSLQIILNLMLAFLLLNFSIDPLDKSRSEDLSINEIESFAELLFENIFENGNMFIETDEGDDNSGQREGAHKYLFSYYGTQLDCLRGQTIDYNSFQSIVFSSLSEIVSTPPPKVS